MSFIRLEKRLIVGKYVFYRMVKVWLWPERTAAVSLRLHASTKSTCLTRLALAPYPVGRFGNSMGGE